VQSFAAMLLAIVLVGCGLLKPSPAYFRPPLPDEEPLPDPAAEDVIPELEALGFECGFNPESDLPSGWSCRRGDQDVGDYVSVGFRSGETGPIDGVGGHRVIQIGPDAGPDPAVLDGAAAADLFEALVAIVVPEEVRPTKAEFLGGIERNYPIELGEGWFIGFDRNSISRTVRIVYSNVDEWP
jgi:hypothetical protein